MKRERFTFALDKLDYRHWDQFERLASGFLVTEFPPLRSLGSPSGDAGRDAELFNPEGDPSIVLQYSVSSDWNTKITRTLRRLQDSDPAARLLIYATNRDIGPRADKLKIKSREEYGIILDIRDRAWFADRYHLDPRLEGLAEDLASRIVDPLLADRRIIESKGIALDSLEARAAFVHLKLQWEDDTREKGLTRLSFEALVRAALRGTNSDHRLTRENIEAQVQGYLPNIDRALIKRYTRSALTRLSKKVLRHWKANDEFCLSYQENERLKDRLTHYDQQDSAFRRELDELLEYYSVPLSVDEIRPVLERVLLSQGERFAGAVQSGHYKSLNINEIDDLVLRELTAHNIILDEDEKGLVVRVVRVIFAKPTDAIGRHLRALADSYTLLAFLRQTADVQGAVAKMFSHGEVWLDTSAVLPLIAETLSEPERGTYTPLIVAAQQAGMRLKVIPGVLEEVERHFNRCFTCRNLQLEGETWKGEAPFLYAVYAASGRDLGKFRAWAENFRGELRPEEDIADYLSQTFGVKVEGLDAEAMRLSAELRAAIQEEWIAVHERRRGQGQRKGQDEYDALAMQRLAGHDAETYGGIIGKRMQERGQSPFGYSAWWLTLDRRAFDIHEQLKERVLDNVASPVMSIDFFANYLSLGPCRQFIEKKQEEALPVFIEGHFMEAIPTEIIDKAEEIRREAGDLPELVVRRRVRDELDRAKMRKGAIAAGGTRKMREIVLENLEG